MIHPTLFTPNSIAVIGASNNLHKPGGKLLHCLKNTSILVDIYPVHPSEKEIQGLAVWNDIRQLPPIDLAIIAIPASESLHVMDELIAHTHVKAVILISAGFDETGAAGRKRAKGLQQRANKAGITLIGPNCIGVLAPIYSAMFVTPLPTSTPGGLDFVSASGAVAAFVFEQAALHGLPFHTVVSVGNSIQTGIEEVLEYWDENHTASSPKIKLVYAETIRDSTSLYRHAASLRRKNCRLIVLHAGCSEAGKQAVLSHTGAISQQQNQHTLLWKKSGALLCNSRTELVHLAAVLRVADPTGNRAGILTNAGGPGILMVDALERAGFTIPQLSHPLQDLLKPLVHSGAAVCNPIDVLATATISQVLELLPHLDHSDEIDFIILLYGSTGMEDLEQVLPHLTDAIQACKKPVYLVMPSVNSAQRAIQQVAAEMPVFFDEVHLAKALGKLRYDPVPDATDLLPPHATPAHSPRLQPEETTINWLQRAHILFVPHKLITNVKALYKTGELHFPFAAKSTGLIHKSERDAVVLNIRHLHDLEDAVKHLLAIEGSTGVMVQEMVGGVELYAGIKRINDLGYALYFGQGGIGVELQKSFVSTLLPASEKELRGLLEHFKPHALLEGYRGHPPVSKYHLAALLHNLSNLVLQHPEIAELDLNPIMAKGETLVVVDARIML